MKPVEPADFYSGLVAELYSALRSVAPDPEPYARFIARSGEPALELGCGDGEPLLELRSRGLDVVGLDSSGDMLERCRAHAADLGLDVVLHHTLIESMDLGQRFRSIYLAGATFNLIVDDETARRALERIREHLEPTGRALIPLFIPEPIAERHLGRSTEQTSPEGTLIRCTTVSVSRNDVGRRQAVILRYERIRDDSTTSLEREWVLHWHTQAGFRQLADDAGLTVDAVVGADGKPAAEFASEFVFIVGPK